MYSNLELRVIAAISEDNVMQKIFNAGGNIHDENTKTFLRAVGKNDSPTDNPSWEPFRNGAKMYIFGRNYGGGLPGMYKRLMAKVPDLEITFDQFKAIDKAYFDEHPQYQKWYDQTVEEIQANKKLTNIFGRVRIFLGEDSSIVREGLNFPIQSAAGDLMSKTIIGVYNDHELQELGGKLIGTVHDSLMIECPESSATMIMNIMEKHATKPVNIHGRDYIFKVDFEVGTSWGNLKGV